MGLGRQNNSLSVDNQVLLPGGGFFDGGVVAEVNASGTQNLNSNGFTGGGPTGLTLAKAEGLRNCMVM